MLNNTSETPKVYIVVNKGTIESVYSEDGGLVVAVFDMDTLQDEPNDVQNEIKKWREDLIKNVRSIGTLCEIDFWTAQKLI